MMSRTIDRLLAWARVHWLTVVDLVMAAVLAGAVAAPIIEMVGYPALADRIHLVYLLLCPQRPEHSYFLFGFQTALEHREIAMLGGMLIGSGLYRCWRLQVRPLPFWVMLIASIPMLWDVLTQMVGWRESDWFTRTWTGGLSTIAYALWLSPRVDPSLQRGGRRVPAGARDTGLGHQKAVSGWYSGSRPDGASPIPRGRPPSSDHHPA